MGGGQQLHRRYGTRNKAVEAQLRVKRTDEPHEESKGRQQRAARRGARTALRPGERGGCCKTTGSLAVADYSRLRSAGWPWQPATSSSSLTPAGASRPTQQAHSNRLALAAGSSSSSLNPACGRRRLLAQHLVGPLPLAPQALEKARLLLVARDVALARGAAARRRGRRRARHAHLRSRGVCGLDVLTQARAVFAGS